MKGSLPGLRRPRLVAWATVGTAVVTVAWVAIGFARQWFIHLVGPNHGHFAGWQPSLDVVATVVCLPILAVSGVYAGCVAAVVRPGLDRSDRRDEVAAVLAWLVRIVIFVPIALASCAGLVFAAGSTVAGVAIGMTVTGVGLAFAVATAWFAGRWFLKVALPRERLSLERAMALVATIGVLLALPVVSAVLMLEMGVPRSARTFPADGPLGDRERWAEATFPDVAPVVARAVRASEPIQRDVGEIVSCGPTADGPNYATSLRGESYAYVYSWEVRGAKGSGVVSGRVGPGGGSMSWHHGLRDVALPPIR